MAIAHANTTSEFAGISSVKGPSGNLMEVDLNETPTVQNKRLISRLESLVKIDEKKETKAVESSVSKLQLDDDTPTSKKKRYRESKKCHSQNEHCAVCLMDGHHQYLCPYLESVPLGVTEVGKVYLLMCRTCGFVGNVCGHGRSYARFNRRSAALKHQYPSHEEVEQIRARQREMAEMSRARVERGEPSLLDDTSSDSSSDTSSDSSSDSSSEI